ncbi:MAG: NeuD/PglB/VioB family sugar acetyltransferase [Salinivirgaceae bacterium]|nr:NeuD/PglB/VioB family sugar acetyltransferase [Salinivirgaceae bacterium]
MKEPIVLIGGGGHCKSCIDVIEAQNKYSIVGIVDKESKKGEKILGYEIFACDNDLPELATRFRYFHITIGQIYSADLRLKIWNILSILDIELPLIISPHAHVSPHAKIGKGSIIMHHALVNAGAEIGMNCIINSKALIEHDVKIGDFCHVSTGAILNGGVTVGNRSFIGSGCVSKEYTILPDGYFAKANTLIK